MNLEHAYQLLGLLPSASEADRFSAYETTRNSLEGKLAKAPTPGLKEKYRTALRQMEEAIEAIENSVDGGELPTLSATPRATPPPAPPPPPAPYHAPAHQRPAPAPARKSRSGEVGLLLFVVAIIAVAGVWYMQKQNEANTAKTELDRGLPSLRAQLEEVTKQVGEYQAARAAAGQSGEDPLASSDPEQVTANLRSLILTAEHAQQKEDWDAARKNMSLAAKELASLKSRLGGATANVRKQAATDQANAVRQIGSRISDGDIAMVRRALSAPGFDVNAPMPTGTLPLVAAIHKGRKDVIALLLAHPAIDPIGRIETRSTGRKTH